MLLSSQVLWLLFGFIQIITVIPGSDGKSNTVDDGQKASALALQCYWLDVQHLEKVTDRENASFHSMTGIDSNSDSKTRKELESSLMPRMSRLQ